MFRRSSGVRRQLLTFVNSLTDLRRCREDQALRFNPSSSAGSFLRSYPGRKIYGPLNGSTEFNCHVAGYYRAPTSLRIAAYGLDVGSMNVESRRAKDNLLPRSGIATSRRLRITGIPAIVSSRLIRKTR